MDSMKSNISLRIMCGFCLRKWICLKGIRQKGERNEEQIHNRSSGRTVMFGLVTMPPILWAAEGDQGRAYYFRYCGSCDGVEGKGYLTVSRSLKLKPGRPVAASKEE